MEKEKKAEEKIMKLSQEIIDNIDDADLELSEKASLVSCMEGIQKALHEKAAREGK